MSDKEYTELVQTRVEPKVKKLIEQMMTKDMTTQAAIVRKALYKGLGLVKED